MKNIHLFPTTDETNLRLIYGKLHFITEHEIEEYIDLNKKYLHLYITNIEEVNVGDFYYDLRLKHITIRDEYVSDKGYLDMNKIVLTNNPKFIEKGIQPIPDVFLLWLVDNSNCEEVEISLQEKYWGVKKYECVIWERYYKN